ncbi:multifunctional aminopeptidase A [Mycoplasma wenyonii str. Massachusetts]|uniref:Probable cytosol aminopeptidase n=1 Tax=Mycoplasma wenyonii (strain Massachusetts) TaxID=1197325 RepID=I6ZIQ1_MYCWM|nr:M17 family metallopeptidase [Mycoplasma wenyonii]AFN65070.1 multifunctional aminopeptidase A [Mycoplasma wenyonii str. Massachusetts]
MVVQPKKDTRVFRLVASKIIDCEIKHLDYRIDYENASAQFFVDPKKVKTKEFLPALRGCLESAYSWDIDYLSFVEATKTGLKSFELELCLRGLIDSILRTPKKYLHAKKQKPKKTCRQIQLIGLKSASKEITNILSCENQIKDWSELPPNILDAEKFVAEIISCSRELNIDYEVLNWDELNLKGFNLTCAVGQNKRNSYLVTLRESKERREKKKDRKRIVIIGKGICFDTGGLSIKTGGNMVGMKFDMTGAGLVAAIFFALAKNKFSDKHEVIAVLPISENLIGSDSIKVDSVIQSYGGKFIEISNTDAEGRLLLAEAISYAAKDLEASEIITVATLTGAVGYALGKKYAGAWSSSEENWKRFNFLADYTGEHVWRLPLDKYYLEKLKSSIAELKNSATTGVGGASRAATFLAEFRDNKDFIHLDIANVSSSSGNSCVALAPLFKTIYFYLKGERSSVK